MTETTRVLVDVNRLNQVSVQVLGEQGGVPALLPSSFFFHLGDITEVVIETKTGRERRVWQWSCDDVTGQNSTKVGAVAAMLADCGYQQVKLTATIPDLLEGL